MSRNYYDEESKPLLPRSNFEDNDRTSVQVYPSYTEDCNVDPSITDPTCKSGNHEERDETQCPSGSTDNDLNKGTEEGAPAPKFQLLGVVLVILARMSFTGSNVIQKFVIPEVTFWQILAIRAIIQTLVMGFSCLVLHFKYRPGKNQVEDFRFLNLGKRFL